MLVASVEYCLARDDRIRPSIEDAIAATGWTLENMRNEFGVDRVILGGESPERILRLVRLRRCPVGSWICPLSLARFSFIARTTWQKLRA